MKHLKYLIFPFLIFSLTLSECTSYSQLSSINYQTSEIIHRSNLLSDSRIYFFGNNYSNKRISLFFLPSFLTFKNSFDQKVRIIIKLQSIVCFNIDDFISEYIQQNNSINSKSSYSSLYIR